MREARSTLILGGSGRTADHIASALRGELSDARTDPLIASGLIQAINIHQTQDLEQRIKDRLTKSE